MEVGKQYNWLGSIWTVIVFEMEQHRCGRITYTIGMRHPGGDLTLMLEGASQLEEFLQSLETV